ncbi:MAG: MFS transporter [Anaerolineales bacterium]
MNNLYSKFSTKDLLFARLYYFTFMGGSGFINPFLNLFYVSLGFSGKQIGLIASTGAIVSMIVSPIWVSYVKRHPHAQRIFQIAIVLGATSYYFLGHQTNYFAVLLIIFLFTLAVSGISPLSDSMAVTISQESGKGYGSVRVWASLGWIFSVLVTGQMVARFGYIAAFVGVAIMWLLAATLIFFIQPRYFTTHGKPDQPRSNIRLAVQRVLQDKTLIGFALALILIGFLNSGTLQFENVFLAELGASKQLISVAGTLSAIVELPFMLYADRIVHRVGVHRMLMIALAMTMLQRLVVLALPFIATIMIIRFIGGVTFSFYTISFIGLISSRTNQSETGTVLALYSVTIAGLVNIFAAPVGGAIFDAVGARWLYAFAAVGYGTAVLILWLTRPKTSAPAQA